MATKAAIHTVSITSMITGRQPSEAKRLERRLKPSAAMAMTRQAAKHC